MASKLLKILLSVGLVVFLFSYVGVQEILAVFRDIELEYILYLFLLSIVLITVSCLKWQIFIHAAGHKVTLIRLIRYYTEAYFFNMFMPSIVGGDVARSVRLGRYLQSYRDAFAATFVERFTGFLAMNLIGVLFVGIGARVTAGVEAAILIVAFVTLLCALVFFSARLTAIVTGIAVRFVSYCGLSKLASRISDLSGRVSEGLHFIRSNNRLFWMALGYSLVFHFLAVLNTYVAARCIGWDTANFMGLCVVVPLVLLVSVAPVTPSAIGIQEGAFLYFLTRLGATEAQGLAVGLVLRAKNIVTALVGGLLWMADRSASKYLRSERQGSATADELPPNVEHGERDPKTRAFI